MNDKMIFSTLKEKLFTAVVGDVMDQMGYRRQFLPQTISPLKSHMKIAGRAMPVLEADVIDDGLEHSNGPLAKKPFGLMLEALDDLKQDEVYIASGASLNYALFGELMATRAIHLGSAGAIVNGYIRDADGIEVLDFPIFGQGLYAQDQGPRGRVIDYRCSIEIGGILIMPGDLIFGDREGVLIIPKEIEKKVITGALEKITQEDKVADAIKAGMSTVEAFEKFGVM